MHRDVQVGMETAGGTADGARAGTADGTMAGNAVGVTAILDGDVMTDGEVGGIATVRIAIGASRPGNIEDGSVRDTIATGETYTTGTGRKQFHSPPNDIQEQYFVLFLFFSLLVSQPDPPEPNLKRLRHSNIIK
jgi:hypothetical protein